MIDFVEIDCPHCGERIEVGFEVDVRGEMVIDCQVCCRPWRVVVERSGGERPALVVEPS